MADHYVVNLYPLSHVHKLLTDRCPGPESTPVEMLKRDFRLDISL